uniref:DUF3715 domain-containing protein n=1 Tax=Electrophorus electricus TaxID=8005 RepID=A0A4W4H7S8_ELEEL
MLMTSSVDLSGLLEPVLPGSVTFDNSILAPLQNSYLYEESKECFTYNSAYLVNNAALQRRYSAFRAEKQEYGYSEEELEESFGFLLFADESEANKLADTGLLVGQGMCTTLGDSSKGVYISKYSDCLDLKRWYDGKTGYIVLLKLIKGRVKEVTENYTQNFTTPSAGFDCHVSEQLRAVCASTSSFLAFERTQYYIYELLEGSGNTESCPRHVCPFAIVAFSYGKTTISLELKEKSISSGSLISVFHYQPWSGQLKIESIVYDVGLKSIHGAMFPANLPKTVKVDHTIGVSELRKTLPEAIFETSLVGEVIALVICRCFSLYDVVSCEVKSDLSLLTHELKEKDMALVIYLDDSGFLVVLHSSHFLSYEGAATDKASALQGMFIFPDSRTVPRETKIGHSESKVSAEVLQVLPALNYAESEMEKCPPNQQGEPLSIVEKHLQNFATLFFPGLSSIPAREASMFPDQYDVPDGFPLIAPKWTEEAGARLNTYMKNPCSFQLSIERTLELLTAGKQQRSDEHDDDVYYYISSPEEAPQTPSGMVSERDVAAESDHIIGSNTLSHELKNAREQQTERQKNVTAELSKDIGTPSAAGVAMTESTDISPKSCDLPTEPCVNTAADSEKTLHSNTANDECSAGSRDVSQEPPIQSTGVALLSLTVNGNDASGMAAMPTQHLQTATDVDLCKKVNCMLDVPHKVGEQMPDVSKEVAKEAGLTIPVSLPVTSVNQMDTLTTGCVEVHPQVDSDVPPERTLNLKLLPRRRGRRKKRGLKRNPNKVRQTPVSVQNTNSPSCSSVEASIEQSSNSETVLSSPSSQPRQKDWRSLPRRKRHWKADISMKRILRSDVKASETKSLVENISDITELAGYMTSTPKRKMDGCSMRERYGLKTIITDCGRIFVPHGSDAAPGDVKLPKDTKDDQDFSLERANSPSKEKLSKPTSPLTHAKSPPLEMEKKGQHMPLTHIQNIPVITSSKAQSSQQATVQAEKDDTSHNNSDQSLDSDLQPTSTEKCKGKIKDHVYRAISISKLKTVLKRAKMTKSPSPGDHGKSDNGEPEVKKTKPNIDVDLTSTSGKSSPHKDMNNKHSVSQDNSESAGNQEPLENTLSKQTLVSWRELKTSSSQAKLMSKNTKENGCITLDKPPPFAVVKQADHQLISTITGDRAEGKNISSDGKTCKEGLATGGSPPSDALNLLADLALSANSDKTANLGEKPRQDTHVGVKTSNSPESVLHALLQNPTTRLKLPPTSPYQMGLEVAGDLMLDISEEHSYSQPTSLLSGLSRACSQVPPPVGCVESLLSLNPGLLKLPDQTSGLANQEKGGKNGWKYLTSLSMPPSSGLKRSKFLRHRRIFEKEGSIQVTRFWREIYDFKFDSKFTNVKLDKTVTRALHGKWDFGIQDNYEQVHLIFHMWIGLFYSKSTSRFFHFDQNCPPLDLNPSQSIGPVQPAVPLPDVGLGSSEDRTTSVQPGPDILDLSLKASGPVSHCTMSQGSSEEDQPSSKRSRPEHTSESKGPEVRANSNLSLTDSIVDDLDGNSVPNNDDYSDIENDSTTETSYTKLLENNNAYSNLCEQTLSMHIDEQKSLKAQKNEPMASGTLNSLDTKALAVFHQVVGPARPKMHTKMPDQVHGRKIILKSLSFKDKGGARTPTSVISECVSKDEEHEAALSGKSRGIAPVHCRNNKDECAFQNLVGHSSASSVAVHGGNDATKLKVKSLLNTSNDIPMNVHNDNNKTTDKIKDAQADTTGKIHDDKTKKQVRPMPDIRHEMSLLDTRDDMSVNKVKDKTPQTACQVNVAKAEVKPKHDIRNYTPVHTQDVNDAKDRITTMHSVRDDTPADVQDVNKSIEDGVKAVHNVQDDTPADVQDVNESIEDGVKAVHNVQDDTPADVQDVNDTKDEVTPVHSVRDDRMVDVQDVNESANVGVKAAHNVQDHTPADVQDINDAAKNEVTPVHTVRHDKLVNVQDVNESTKDGVTPVHSVQDHTPADVQDVNDTKDEVTPVHSVRDDRMVDVQDVNESANVGVKAADNVQDHTPADVQDINDAAKNEVTPVHTVRHDKLVNVQDVNESTKDGVTPVHSVLGDTPIDVQNTNDAAKDEVTPVHGVRDDKPVDVQDVNESIEGGVKAVHNVQDDTPADVQDVNDTKDEITPVHSVRDDKPEDVQDVNESAKDGVTPVHSVQDDTPIDVKDINVAAKDRITPVQRENDDTPIDVQDVNYAKEGDTPVQSVIDDTPIDVQYVNDSEERVTPAHSVRDDATVQDVNDETKKAKPKSDARESVSEHPDVDQTEGMVVDEVQISSDITEHMVERDENKTREEEFLCNNTNLETVSEKQKDSDDEPHVSALEQDFTDSVHVEICDEKTLEEMHVDVSGGETPVEQISSMKEDNVLKRHEGEVATEISVVKNDRKQTRDYAQPEIAEYFSADDVSSKAHCFLLKEGDRSPAVSDMCILTENDKSTVLHPSSVVQNETPEINQRELKETHVDVSSCTAVINQESGTDQKHLAPTICETFADEVPGMSSGDSQNVSTPSIQINSELGMTSRSSTPTQDELPYTQEVCENIRIQQVGHLQDNHTSEQVPHSVTRSPTIAGSALNSSIIERHISSSPCYKVQSFPQGPDWSSYEATGDLTDESRSLTQKPVPKQNLRNLVHETISSRELSSKENQSQKYQYGHFSEQYKELSPELSSWAHGSSFKTDRPSRLREPYACDQDSEGFPTHFSISDNREFAYMPKDTTESESHIPDWVHQIHYADSKYTVHESNERAFPYKHRSDLSLSESNEESESQGMGSIRYSRKKSKRTFCQDEWNEEDFDGIIDYSIKKTFSCGVERTKILKTHTFSPYQCRRESRQIFDWRRYFRREGVFKLSEGNDRFVHNPPSSIVTVFDKKGNRVIFENPSTLKRSIGAHGVSVKDSFHTWEDQRSKSNITQSLMELEYLIFSEKMNQMLKNCKATSKPKSQHRHNVNSVENLMTIRFSRLEEEDTTAFDETWPTLPKFKINVDMSERKGMRKIINYGKPLHLQSLFCERGTMAACSRISDITKDCAKSYNSMMNDVCAGKTIPHQNNKSKRKWDIESTACIKQSAFCGRIKKDMFDNLHDNLNSIVRQACKIKYKFYILVTSSDSFFEETKELLEAEGHAAVEPYQFEIDESGQTPLLILLRNEDIAEHICEVPHLLELKKSSRVLFAGIDRPDDVVNLTHQEVFARGGFVVFDEAALDALSLENMKKVVGVMEELDKKGKWKWFLHYRDSRKLRENVRCSPDAQKRKHFVDCCQEAGIVEVLPYHECDVISRGRPDYLRCLVHLQIQNVSARFPVFITDTPADSFGKNGILTMNIYAFSRILSNDSCLVS